MSSSAGTETWGSPICSSTIFSALSTSTGAPLTRGFLSLWRSISKVPIGPPTRPPETMPNMAAATAIVAAPLTPAFSKSGAKARPVAGPPVRQTEPANTPIRGLTPTRRAIPIPQMFWSTAKTVAATKKIKT